MERTGSPPPEPPGPSLHENPEPAGALVIVPLTSTDTEAAARLYTRVFLEDEPTSRRRALDPGRFLPYARAYVRWLADNNLSYLAKDADTGEYLGFIFCFDFLDDPGKENAEVRELLVLFRQVVSLIDELEARHICREELHPGSVLHIFQIGVDRKGREKGIARALIRRVISCAKERGFSRMIADCTSPASEHAFAACGFSRAGFLSYDSFFYEGACFFAGLDGGISLMVCELPANLTGPAPSVRSIGKTMNIRIPPSARGR